MLGTLNWLDDDELDGVSFVCCKSPSGLLDAIHAGTKDLGLPKRGSLLQLHSNLWLLYVVAFRDLIKTTEAGTSGSSSNKGMSASAGGALGGQTSKREWIHDPPSSV